jgi:hypothetical protein
VARDSSAAAGTTLASALGVMLQPSTGEAAAQGDFRTRVRRLYEEMREAMRSGDWLAFGRAYDALGKLIASGAQ